MLSQRSLKNRFLFELAVAMTAMLVLVTVIFYSYLSTNLFESVQSSLEIKSQYIISKYQSQDEFEKDINPSVLNSMFDTTVQIIPTTKDKLPLDKNFQDYNSNEHYFLEYTKIYPNQDKYLNLRCLIKFLLKKAQLLALFRSTFDHFYKIQLWQVE